jgi:hypothetical protein
MFAGDGTWADVDNTVAFFGGVEVGYVVEYVPEPSTFVLLAIGAIGLFAWRRRRQAA